MGLDFWSTIRGHELADCLIRELPKITVMTNHYVRTMPDSEVHEFVTECIENGYTYVDHISIDGKTTVIMCRNKK